MLVNFKLQLITSKHMYGKRVLLQSVVRFNNYTVRHYQKKKTQRLLEFLAAMPKPNTSRIMDAQRQRQQISKKAQNYVPSTIYLQVVGSGARGVPNTLYLFTDQKRYLFNCGESTQRLAHEHKVKLTRLDHIFITNKTWKNIGGLPGLSLTLQDVGVPNITLHGPQGLDELYKATKRFVIMKDMNVTLAPCSPSKDFVDNVMTVKYVLLRPENILKPDMNPPKKPKLSSDTTSAVFEEFIHDETDYYNPDVRNMEEKKNSKQRNKSPEKVSESVRKKAERALHELEGKSQCTVAYICSLKKRLGTLDLAKCVEKGVKPGPLLGQLKNGHDVILPDGSHVKSKDVKTPDDPGPVFIVLEVPDISYLTVDDFSSHFDNGINSMENIPALVVHFTPPHVFRHPIYRMFVSKFGSSTQHLVLNEENSCLGSEAVHRTQHRLHVLDADVFPLLRDATIPAVWNSHPPTDGVLGKANCMEELKNRIAFAQFQNIIRMEEISKDNIAECTEAKYDFVTGRTLTMFHLRPKKCLDRSAEPKLHVQDYIKETMEVEGFSKSLEQYREIVSKMGSKKEMFKAEYPKVIFLGTGSCIPSKTRNTSAIVILIDENRSMLLDCGEGTFGQLVRFFGPKRVNNFLRSLSAVYISHLHADHHMGLIGVLQARREAFSEQSRVQYEPVQLLAPGQIVTWLFLYDQQFENIRDDYSLITNQSLLEAKSNSLGTEMTPAALSRIGVQHIRTCLVSHCPNAFGVAIDVDGHHKITYSGDTIPCKELITIGQNSTLLIHEATMEDELAEEARTKMHSTTSQAIQMGRQMCAKYTVLTHFSQRYARLPRLSAHILHDNASVGVAFDNMQIRMKDLELLPYMYAPLQLMFAEHCVELEVKAAHRARRRDLATGSPPPAVQINVTSMKGYGGKELQQTCPGPGRMQRTNEKGKGQPSIYRNTDTPRASDRFSGISNLAKFGTPVRDHSGSSTRSVEHRRPYRPASAESCRGALTRDRSASSSKSTESRGRNQTTFPATCAVNKRPQIQNKVEAVRTPERIKSMNFIKTRGACTTFLTCSNPDRPLTRSNLLNRIGSSTTSNSIQKPFVRSGLINLPPKSLRPTNMVQSIESRPRFNCSPRIERGNISARKVPSENLKLKNKFSCKLSEKSNVNQSLQNVSIKKVVTPVNEQNIQEKQTIRRSQIETLKNTFCREVHDIQPLPNASSASGKRYKPQLEDIKSSYLLLNKKNVIDRNIENIISNDCQNRVVSKPEPLNEMKRREQLIKAREKYKSKKYWNESKYRCIEGLNWISWK